MHHHNAPYSIFSLGDASITIDLGNVIQVELNRKVLAIQRWVQEHPFEGLKDCRVAYSSVTLVYDPGEVKRVYNPEKTVFSFLKNLLEEAYRQAGRVQPESGRLVRIPVCYEPGHAMDLEQVAVQKKLSTGAIIKLHQSVTYRVYMIGFLPGFAYMGQTDAQLTIPRKPQPVPVKAGSVGITGSQTGIYPLNCPGGWYIIGRTPLPLFDPAAENPVLLQPGDEVQFYSISGREFERLYINNEQAMLTTKEE